MTNLWTGDIEAVFQIGSHAVPVAILLSGRIPRE